MQYLKSWVKKNFAFLIYRKQYAVESGRRFRDWIQDFTTHPEIPVQEASRDLFTYHGEDGILAWLLARMKDVPPVFADIGSGDCIKSNCACLAVHAGWSGCFIDSNEQQLAIGKSFYRNAVKGAPHFSFIKEKVTPFNINDLLKTAGISGKTGLLSIDIDGNDFWIWKAVEVIQPRIVVIEAKVEFGPGNYAVPYGDFNHHSGDARYNGASVDAFRRLGLEKGYKLVAANKQGYNLFFVQVQEDIKTMSVEEVLSDPDTQQSFYKEDFFNSHRFVTA
jgi:hypothetical protein